MGHLKNMFRRFVPLLVAFLVLSTVFFAPVKAQDDQTGPSIPEFTLQTQIGANVTTITLIIQNQPFDVTNYPNDGFFYNVRIRIGGGNWSELYTAEDWYLEQSNESTTTITYNTGETAYLQQETSQGHPVIPTSGTVEFEVQAMIGHRDRGDLIPGTMIMPYVFVGVTSDWSQPQTVNLNPATPTPSLTATVPPSGKPDASSWALLGLLVAFVAGLMTAAVILKRKGQKLEKSKQQP